MLFECCRYNLYKYRIIVALQWPEGCQAEHLNYRNRTMHMHRNRKRCDSFFMVSMASGKDCESIHRKTMSHNMVIILQLIPSLGLQHTCLIYLDIHIMVNCHLSKQGICWPVSHDHIAGSSFELTKVTCLMADQVMGLCWIVDSGKVSCLGAG